MVTRKKRMNLKQTMARYAKLGAVTRGNAGRGMRYQGQSFGKLGHGTCRKKCSRQGG